MIPQFDSQVAMINYFKSLEGSDFDRLLRDEFNFDPPVDAPLYQREYLFKYLVQGMVFQKKTGDDLIKYAVDRTENLVKTQPHLKVKGTATPIPTTLAPAKKAVSVKNGKIRQKHFGADGEIKFVEHRKVYVGFFGGKVVVTKKTEEACRKFLKDTYNI